MKRLLFLLWLFCSANLYAQDISGEWYAYPDLKTHRLRLQLELTTDGGRLAATLRIPDQSDRIYSATRATLENGILDLDFPDAQMACRGRVESGERIAGTLSQDGYAFELLFTRQPVLFRRPQTPQPPFPYTSEEVRFRNPEAGIMLAGTLTLPASSTPSMAVVLISGSGAQDRDNTFFEHKTFWVMADCFARHGIAVLRVDDRGTGASEGDFNASGLPDHDTDAQAALAYLRSRPEIDTARIGAIGHSEGAFIAFSLAARQEVDFIVTMAGGGVNGSELLLMQRAALLRASGAKEEFITRYNDYMRRAQEVVLQTADAAACERRLAELFAGSDLAGQAPAITKQLYNTAKIELLKYDPEWDFPEITCPVLALNGDKDRQVPVENLALIEKGIAGNGNPAVTAITYPGLNHMFQTAGSGLPVEYSDLEETIFPKVLEDMVAWMKQLSIP